MKINNKSWHYHLAVHYASTFDTEPTDLCTYVRKVITGMFLAVLIVLIVPIFIVPLVEVIGSWFISGGAPWIPPSGDALLLIFGYMELALIAVIGLSIWTVETSVGSKIRGVANAAGNKIKELDDGFFVGVYRAWKEKTCVLLHYGDL